MSGRFGVRGCGSDAAAVLYWPFFRGFIAPGVPSALETRFFRIGAAAT
jgi:hypothetical protein